MILGEQVTLEIVSHSALITLNQPEANNAIDRQMMDMLGEAIDEVKGVRSVRSVIITGSGDNFCVGGKLDSDLFDPGEVTASEAFLNTYKPFLNLLEVEVPTIGALNGSAVGGGLGIALLCDMRVANCDARYGVNFSRIGIHSGMGISYALPMLVGLPKANEMLLAGRLLDGYEAERIGLVNYAVERDRVMDKSRELAKLVNHSAPIAVRMMKRSIYRAMQWDVRRVAELEAHLQSETYSMQDAKEGISAFLEKRPPSFIGK